MKNIYRNTGQEVVFDNVNGLKASGNPIYPYPIEGQEQVSSLEADQTFVRQETGLWEPLGPVTENRWSYTLPTWDFVKGTSTPGQVAVQATYELPELLAMAGLPSAIYIYFSFSTGTAVLADHSDWSCIFDLSKLFEDGSFSSPTFYVTDYLACFGARVIGKLLPRFDEAPTISFTANTYQRGSEAPGKMFLNFSVNGTSFELA